MKIQASDDEKILRVADLIKKTIEDKAFYWVLSACLLNSKWQTKVCWIRHLIDLLLEILIITRRACISISSGVSRRKLQWQFFIQVLFIHTHTP